MFVATVYAVGIKEPSVSASTKDLILDDLGAFGSPFVFPSYGVTMSAGKLGAECFTIFRVNVPNMRALALLIEYCEAAHHGCQFECALKEQGESPNVLALNEYTTAGDLYPSEQTICEVTVLDLKEEASAMIDEIRSLEAEVARLRWVIEND